MSKNTNKEKGDKKKKNVPQSENAKAKMQYMELDEEEVEHLRQLDMKYRDRAKERREGLAADEELENDEENLLIEGSDSEEEVFTKTTGLDFDLLRKTKEKEALEKEDMLEEEANRMVVNGTAQRTEIKGGFKTNFGANIHRILFKENTVKESRRNIFKSSNNCYEFDVDVNFGSNLPKLVIRTRDTKTETEPLVSMQLGDNVLGKINKIMTYIKTGKKAEPKKDLPQDNKAQKPKDSIFNPISSYNMDDGDDDDEDSIFPGARKRVKADEGPKSAVMYTPEELKQVKSDQPVVKGIFDAVKTAKENEKKMEVEEEDILGSKKIEEKNKQLIEELTRKRFEEKLQQLQSRDKDYYTECFIKETPKLEDLKNEQKGGKGGKQKSGKSKKKGLNKQVEQVTKIMDKKRAGGGGGGDH